MPCFAQSAALAQAAPFLRSQPDSATCVGPAVNGGYACRPSPSNASHERASRALLAHFLALSPDDRAPAVRLARCPRRASAAYVRRIDFDRDAAFGVHDDSLRARRASPTWRFCGRPRGARARRCCRTPRARRSAVRCSSAARGARAQPIRAHALHALPPRRTPRSSTSRSSFGMHIVTEAGDADAHLELPPASAGLDRRRIRRPTGWRCTTTRSSRSVAAWKGVNTALRRRAARRPLRVRASGLAPIARGQDRNVTPDRYLAHLRGTLERIRADGFYKIGAGDPHARRSPAIVHRRRRRGRQLLRQQLPRPRRRSAARRRGAGRSRPLRLRDGVRALHLRHAERAQGARSARSPRSSAPTTRSSTRAASTPTAGCSRRCSAEEDAVISDELNHASIVDGIRLCKAQPLPLSQQRHGGPRGEARARPTPPARASS